jgi:hypothetical protein
MIEHPFGRTTKGPMRFSGRLVPPDGSGRPALAVVLMQDV